MIFNCTDDEKNGKISFNIKIVSYGNHVKWYERLLADSNKALYVMADIDGP